MNCFISVSRKLSKIFLQNRDIDYRASCLVLVRVILERFRFNVANRAPEMMSVLLSLLGTHTHTHTSAKSHPRVLSEESSVDFRRLASSVVGSLSCVASDSLLASLMKTVLDATQQILNSCSSDSRLQTYIETIAHIRYELYIRHLLAADVESKLMLASHKSGSRVIPYLSTIVPLLEGICDADRPVDASDADEGLVELRENALKVRNPTFPHNLPQNFSSFHIFIRLLCFVADTILKPFHFLIVASRFKR